jgi:hypothetical protein
MLLFASASWAEERYTMPTLNQMVRGQWLQLSIVGGRISLDGSRVDGIQTGSNSKNQKEQLNINIENGEASATYECTNPKEAFSFLIAGSRFHIRRGPNDSDSSLKEKKPLVDYSQTVQGTSVLLVEIDGKQRTFSAPGLWHLFILYPEESRKYLAPLLQMLQPNWKLADQASALEAELLRDDGIPPAFDRSNWARWVAELGDESFARREAADRSLRAASPALLVYLQQIDANQLDAEQQFRLRRIVEMLSQKISNDSPSQIAAWLAGDPAIWLAFLSRPEVSSRRIAAKRLAAILEGPLPVDPEADPASQTARFEKLRSQLELPGVAEKTD